MPWQVRRRRSAQPVDVLVLDADLRTWVAGLVRWAGRAAPAEEPVAVAAVLAGEG